MMRNIFLIIVNDIRLFFRDRSNLIGLLVLPIVLTVILGFVSGGFFEGEDPKLLLDVMDPESSEVSLQFLGAIRDANRAIVLCPMDNDQEDLCALEGETLNYPLAIARAESGITEGLIQIPLEFSERVHAQQEVQILFHTQGAFGGQSFIQGALDSALHRVNGSVLAGEIGTEVIENSEMAELDAESRAQLREALYERAEHLWERQPVRLKYTLSETGQDPAEQGGLQTGLGQSVPGMGSMFVLFTVFGGITALIVERNQWTLQRLAVMPIRRSNLLGGKVASRFSLGFLQYLLLFAVGAILGMNFGRDPLALLLIAVTYTLAVTAFSFALGTQLKNESQAAGLTLLFSLVFASLGGAWWPLEIVPQWMRVVGHLSPIAWAMDGYRALIFENGGLGDVMIPIAVLLAFALISFIVAARRFRYTSIDE